jgi:hypothetical protein
MTTDERIERRLPLFRRIAGAIAVSSAAGLRL